MKFLKSKDVVSGLFLVIFSVGTFYSTREFDQSSISAYGNPAVVPRIVIGIIFVLAVLILLDGGEGSATEYSGSDNVSPKRIFSKEHMPKILTFILLTAYVLTIKAVGFVITTTLYLGLQMFILSCFDRKKIWLFLIISCIISPMLFYAFRTFFDVLLPAGILSWNP